MDIFDTTYAKDKVDDLKVKNGKKKKIVKRKASLFKEMMNKVVALEAGGSTSHEFTSTDEETKEMKKNT